MRSTPFLSTVFVAIVVGLGPGPRAQEAPRVVRLTPAAGACDVDPATATELVVEFDRPMSDQGMSICGGGPAFPKLVGKPTWRDAKTLVAQVALEPDHDYQMSLNCPAARNFRSADGVELAPVAWAFSTLPATLPDPESQRDRNTDAVDALRDVLAARYSYYDLRVNDWPARFDAARAALLAAPTDKVWASRAAQLLAAAEDIHLTVRCGERVFATGTRAVDPLFRAPTVQRVVALTPCGPNAASGRTDDGIGYLLIGGWTANLDLDAIERAIAALADTRAMVIDVRPNSGGDELRARRIAAWFVVGEQPYAKCRTRERAGADGFGPASTRTVTGNAVAARRYEKPIAVLTSRYVMSSNESFVMMLQRASDCTVVGQPTFGSSGNPRPHELPNGVVVMVPSWQDLRLDGTSIEGEGVAPDVAVTVDPAVLGERDPILEKAFELLRAKADKR